MPRPACPCIWGASRCSRVAWAGKPAASTWRWGGAGLFPAGRRWKSDSGSRPSRPTRTASGRTGEGGSTVLWMIRGNGCLVFFLLPLSSSPLLLLLRRLRLLLLWLRCCRSCFLCLVDAHAKSLTGTEARAEKGTKSGFGSASSGSRRALIVVFFFVNCRSAVVAPPSKALGTSAVKRRCTSRLHLRIPLPPSPPPTFSPRTYVR